MRSDDPHDVSSDPRHDAWELHAVIRIAATARQMVRGIIAQTVTAIAHKNGQSPDTLVRQDTDAGPHVVRRGRISHRVTLLGGREFGRR